MNTPARRLIKPTTPRTVHLLNLRGILPAPVQSEAKTESAFVLLAALCPATTSIASQPERLALPGKTYTPDYLVRTVDGGASYWEVKLEARIAKYRGIFGLAAAHLAERASPFFIVSEKTLYGGAVHLAARLVMRYAKASFPDVEVIKVINHMRSAPNGASIEELTTRLHATKELIFHLIARRLITFKETVSTAPTTRLIHPDFMEMKNALHLANWFGVSAWRANT